MRILMDRSDLIGPITMMKIDGRRRAGILAILHFYVN
jgi:hypothetical protein